MRILYTFYLFILFNFGLPKLNKSPLIDNSKIDVFTINVNMPKFHLSPPPCGFQRSKSFYTAYVNGIDKFVYGDSIIVMIYCKKDLYEHLPTNSNLKVTLKENVFISKNSAYYNFSSLSDDDIFSAKIFEVLEIKRQ